MFCQLGQGREEVRSNLCFKKQSTLKIEQFIINI
jgi:hypothetical protein